MDDPLEGENDGPEHRCETCGDEFDSLDEYLDHVRDAHLD